MKKTIDTLRTLSKQEILKGLNDFIDENSCALSLSKECRDYLAKRAIYGPYRKLGSEIL